VPYDLSKTTLTTILNDIDRRVTALTPISAAAPASVHPAPAAPAPVVTPAPASPAASAKPLVGWSGAAIFGVVPHVVGAWMNRATWDDVAGARWLSYSDPLKAFVAAHPDGIADVGVPLIPHDSPPAGWNTLLAEGASGTRDDAYRGLGAGLAAVGPATVSARLWWEFNIGGDAANIDRAAFVKCWQRAAPLIRAGFAAAAPTKKLLLTWCPNSDGAPIEPFWPGAQHVDVVGLDAYASKWGTAVPSKADVLALVQSQLDRTTAFAKSVGKPVALGEWGNMTVKQPGPADSQGLGDCPEYIDLIFEWATKVGALYLSYFNINAAGGITFDQTPNSLARFQARAAALA